MYAGGILSCSDVKLTGLDWIPPELGQQTQTLLRMTMESRLTEKVGHTCFDDACSCIDIEDLQESPGFIYAYELRDLQTVRTSYFKVGRRDNVPRRIGQWTNRKSFTSTLLHNIYLTKKQNVLPNPLHYAISSHSHHPFTPNPTPQIYPFNATLH